MIGVPGSSAMPRAVAIVPGMSAGSRTGARSDEPRPAREAVGDRRREAQAEARLAGPAGPGQRQQARLGEGRREGVELVLAPDEVGRRRRQVRGGVDGPQRALVVGRPGTTSRWRTSGTSKSLRRRGPTSTKVARQGPASRRPQVVSETAIWPPFAAAETRAA